MKVIITSCFVCVLLALIDVCNTTEDTFRCKDEHGYPVDWYVLYKLPRIKKSNDSLIRDGTAYTMITSNQVAQGWVLSTKSINDSSSIPGQTIAPLYALKDNSSLLWILYNDQAPKSPSIEDCGHTKGVVVATNNGGFWLVHSVPHFAPIPHSSSGYMYPSTGTHYGQSFLCISMNASQLDLVGLQLSYNEPHIYSAHIPVGLENVYPHLSAAGRNITVHSAPWFHQQTLTSLAGQMFHSFAKSGKFAKELYSDLVAPSLVSNLLVESWQNGEGKLPSECNKRFRVENVRRLNIDAAKADFTSTKDHSKWAISDSESNTWVCIGDINRMIYKHKWWYMLQEEQLFRGGGTICINHAKLWNWYRRSIKMVEKCYVNLKKKKKKNALLTLIFQ